MAYTLLFQIPPSPVSDVSTWRVWSNGMGSFLMYVIPVNLGRKAKHQAKAWKNSCVSLIFEEWVLFLRRLSILLMNTLAVATHLCTYINFPMRDCECFLLVWVLLAHFDRSCVYPVVLHHQCLVYWYPHRH